MDFLGGIMKFKWIYVYPVLIILIVVIIVITATNKKSPTVIQNKIANKEIPNDDVHKRLNNLDAVSPNKQNVTSSVFERMETLRKEVEKNPNDTLKLREYADFLAAAHKPDEAITYYEKILKLYPEKKEILFTLSFLYYNKGDINEAEKITNKIIQIDPKDSQALYNLGAINASKGNKNKAREIWEGILKEYPESSSADLAKSALAKL